MAQRRGNPENCPFRCGGSPFFPFKRLMIEARDKHDHPDCDHLSFITSTISHLVRFSKAIIPWPAYQLATMNISYCRFHKHGRLMNLSPRTIDTHRLSTSFSFLLCTRNCRRGLRLGDYNSGQRSPLSSIPISSDWPPSSLDPIHLPQCL